MYIYIYIFSFLRIYFSTSLVTGDQLSFYVFVILCICVCSANRLNITGTEEKLICPNQFHSLLSCLNLTSIFFRLQSVKQANWLVIHFQHGGKGEEYMELSVIKFIEYIHAEDCESTRHKFILIITVLSFLQKQAWMITNYLLSMQVWPAVRIHLSMTFLKHPQFQRQSLLSSFCSTIGIS